MKKIILPIAAVALLFTASCSGPSADQAEVSDAQEVTNQDNATAVPIVLSDSKIEWIGSKISGSAHNGTIDLKSGELLLTGEELTGGSFIMDMNTINPLDQDEENNNKLKGHLLSPDFFDVPNHPEGRFVITDISPIQDASALEMKTATHMVTGDLTLRGVEKSVKIPAQIEHTDSQVTAHAVFNLIRTDFGVNYNSDENDPDLRDNLINKEVHITIHVVANK